MADAASKTLLIDNGAFTIKAFYWDGTANSPPYLVIPNAVGASTSLGRGLVGQALCRLPQYHSLLLQRPIERGLLVDAELQCIIWESILEHFHIDDEREVDVVVTVPHGMPEGALEQWQALIEACGFRSVVMVSSATLALVAAAALQPSLSSSQTSVAGGLPLRCLGAATVLDVGFSCSTSTAFLSFHPVVDSIARSDVGGKVLTNRLKEVISFTQVNLLEDTWMVNVIKEACCCVAPDGRPSTLLCGMQSCREQSSTSNKRRRDGGEGNLDSQGLATADASDRAVFRPQAKTYILPTVPAAMPVGLVAPKNAKNNSALKDAQSITLKHERFIIPEALFSPRDHHLTCDSVVELAVGGVASSNGAGKKNAIGRGTGRLLDSSPMLNKAVRRSVVVFGGSTNLPGFTDRFLDDVQSYHEGAIDVVFASSLHTEILSILGAPSASSLHHGSAELLPLVGAVLLWRHKRQDYLGQLRHAIVQRGAVTIPATERSKKLIEERLKTVVTLTML